MSLFRLVSVVLIMCLIACGWLHASPAHAGCGCEKPPPVPAQIRPHATHSGAEIHIFHRGLRAGADYEVRFVSGTTSTTASVMSQAATLRDLGSGTYKAQLVVRVPDLPLGPTAVEVIDVANATVLLSATDDAFTVVALPIILPSARGAYELPGYQAAVGRDGIVYIALDLTGMHMPLVIQARAATYPLRFHAEDVVFYNVQGFLMQRLDRSIPGLFSLDDAGPGSPSSDTLYYSRHEFNTYFIQHDERQAHDVAASDSNWHLDGTRHIDHDHLIVAIDGTLADGSSPTPGATPPFDLLLNAYSLFHRGLVGTDKVQLTGKAQVYGDVASDGTVEIKDEVRVHGSVTGKEVKGTALSRVTGLVLKQAAELTEFLPVTPPTGLIDLRKLEVQRGTRILQRGSYSAAEIKVSNGATLRIDNSRGPVTIYVNGVVDVSGSVEATDPDPEKFAVYVNNDKDVKIQNSGVFAGVIYAPRTKFDIAGSGELFGAFVGREVKVSGDAVIQYDSFLRERPEAAQ